MREQNEAQDGARSTNDDPIPPLIKAYIDKQIKNANGHQQDSRKKKWKNAWRSASPITKGTFVMTMAITVATVAYSFIAGCQLSKMSGQLTAMNEQTSAAQYSAEVSDKSVLLAQKTERDSRLLGEKQMTETLNQFRQDQRAWLGINEFRFKPNSPRQIIEMKITNTGKSPALDVTFGTKTGLERDSADWNTIYRRKRRFHFSGNNLGAIPPQGYRVEEVWNDTFSQAAKSGGVFWYVYGVIRYRDSMTPEWHHTYYCFFAPVNKPEPLACPVPVPMD